MGKIMINSTQIAKVMLGSIAVKRIYDCGAIVYDTGVQPTPQPCFEVVSAISEASGDYVDVYVKSLAKWYKRNNLNAYEEYGVMEHTDDLSTTTYYVGKLVILTTDVHEYRWDGVQWVDLGAAGSQKTTYYLDPPTSNSTRYLIPFGYYFGTGYKMMIKLYTTNTTWYGDAGGFMNNNSNTSPIEFNFYSNGYYIDYHNPTSTTSPSCYSGDYSTRVMKTSAFNNYKNKNVIFQIVNNKITVYDAETGSEITSMGGGSVSSITGWYDGLYTPIYNPNMSNPCHVAYIQVYDANDVKVNDIRPVLVNGEIQLYDSVINAYYHNTTSYDVIYHTETEYIINPPVDYDTKVPPADNVHYDTLAELELMECPWIGMTATVGSEYTVYVYTDEGWVLGEMPLDLPYLRFTTSQASTFTFTKSGLKYSINGSSWKTLEANVATPTVASGSYIIFKGSCTPSVGIGTFSATGNFNVSGNVMSMLYDDDFTDKLSLAGKSYAFESLFKNNTKLKQVTEPILPATTLSYGCYQNIFNGCSGLTSVPSNLLPATTMQTRCYQEAFSGCSSLTTPPELPATNLATYCYYTMFQRSGLKTLPTLPATVMVDHCYDTMFNYVGANIPDNYLPSTQLAPYCYYAMFANDTGRKRTRTMSVLPATVLAPHCYDTMFINNYLITTPPALPAETLVDGCYNNMFGSTGITSLIALFTTTPSSSYTLSWLNGTTSGTRTFYKNPNATWDQTITRGTSTVPSNWTISDYQEPNYLKFTTVEASGSTYQFNKDGLEYSIDNGTWTTLAANTATPNVPQGSNIRFRGYLTPSGSAGIGTFSSSGTFNAEGDLMTLLYGQWYFYQTDKLKSYTFSSLFQNSKVVDATNLIIPNAMGNYYYQYMFSNCTYLTSAPSLPFSQVIYYGCQYMFSGCTSLTTIQPMTIGLNGTGSMYYMFYRCTSLVDASMITITKETWDACRYMFSGCTSLRKSPIIKGNITQASCVAMFSGCTSLEEVVYLGTTSPNSLDSGDWLYKVPATGTFNMNENATWDQTVSRDGNGVPSGWTIVKVDPSDY